MAQNMNGCGNPVGFRADIGNSWLALNAGLTTVMADGLRLYGSVGYDQGLDGSRQAATGRARANGRPGNLPMVPEDRAAAPPNRQVRRVTPEHLLAEG